ncbi:TIGR01244 family sulfur transferase [Bartonella bacilliformis]|uniref:TIGR01244 family protein n=1 Tax=Bartonella bacilliformis Ver097 TaxID=1293911 RepID=A0A072RA47_BARBA|nr:TIGR01244 family sulfur transferase [Bartonella bacilliformis]KEG18344.1 TIGR01244 family protein [Bartonella bacilliformis Ver097]
MKLQQIEDDVFISTQIDITHMQTLIDVGIKTIICNRPDKEDPNQPDFSIIQEAAQHYGIQAYYVPVVPPTIEQSSVEAMRQILTTASYPILAYCNYGIRSVHLYHLARP